MGRKREEQTTICAVCRGKSHVARVCFSRAVEEVSVQGPEKCGDLITLRLNKVSEAQFPEPVDKIVGGRVAVAVLYDGIGTTALLDTGAMVNLITAAAVRKLKQKWGESYLSSRITETNLGPVCDRSGNTVITCGRVIIKVKWLNGEKDVACFIHENCKGNDD
ncbi:unnamed protein product [Gongylonema pulchrum]|uniref:Peptidase A2 domain-containing protein n=1 Tax=Gongylonema pulchrum TaxID=637853 RepID=A0A183DZ61_9BILA|nr:unnamed protein product [Gongylonema pulchrum]